MNDEILKDVQSTPDDREIALKKVGIKKLQYPITVLDKKNGKQNTVANVSLFVNLPHHFKGTHMSRFVEVFNKYSTNISMKEFMNMLEEMAVNQTGVSLEMVNSRYQESTATHLTMSNARFLIKVYARQKLYEPILSAICEISDNI